MSIGIFIIAILTAIAALFLGSLLEEYGYNKKAVVFPFVCIGVVLSLVLVAMSFCFTSFRCIRYSLAYDHVVELEWKPEITNAPENLDWTKVIYHDVYSGAACKECEYVVMAWNDKEETTKSYDELVKNMDSKR